MPFRYGPNAGWGGPLFGLLLFLIFVAVIVWAIMFIARERGVRHGHGQGWGPGPGYRGGPGESSSDALKILNERFARGEIDAAEYTERRDLIKGST